MEMKKKFFTFLTILVVIITASTACFGAEENSKNENTQEETNLNTEN